MTQLLARLNIVIGYLQLLRDRIRRKIGIFLFDKQVPPGLHGEINHILVIRWDAKLGDSFVSSFFFRELRKLPNKVITVITTPSLEALYKDGFGVDHVIAVGKRPDYKTLHRIASSIGHVDLAVHLTEGMKMKDLYFLHKLSPSNTASLDDNIARVNIKLASTTKGLLFQEKYSYLLNLLGLKEIDAKYIIPQKEINRAIDGEYILINPFGSTRYKSISYEKMTSLLLTLSFAFPFLKFGLLSSPLTRDAAQRIIRHCSKDNVVLLEGVNTIDDAISYISSATAVISVDTAIVHIAVGLEKPLVAIYPCHGDDFNQWLPSPSLLTKVVFSRSSGINSDMNNVEDYEISDALSVLLSIEK